MFLLSLAIDAVVSAKLFLDAAIGHSAGLQRALPWRLLLAFGLLVLVPQALLVAWDRLRPTPISKP